MLGSRRFIDAISSLGPYVELNNKRFSVVQ